MQAQRMSEIPFSGIREIFEECNRLEDCGRDIVHLEIGRPDFDTPEPIKAAGMNAIEDGKVHYTSNYGIRELRRKVSNKLANENELAYDPEREVVVTSGATEAVFTTIVALVDDGEEVLIPDLCWTYEPAIRVAGGEPVRYHLDPDAGFQPDVDSLEKRVSDRSKLLVVNTPHNPTGGVLSESVAREVRDFAVENDLLVISDEIYEKILYEGTHYSLASFDGMYERTVTINGFSKAYSMTGWRLGYLAAPEHLVDPIIRLRQYTSTCATSISQHAGRRALDGELFAPMVAAFEERRDVLFDRLESIPGMSCPKPSGAFYAMPTIPDCAANDESFAWSLLEDEGIAVVPGSVFGPAGSGRVRMAYTTSTNRIDEAFDRIEDWIGDH